MKYDVTYSCGHTATVKLFGKTEDRERKLHWMETDGMCPDCYREWIREENARKLCETIRDITLPQLTAKSDKQLAYAESKRSEYILDHVNHIKQLYAIMHMDEDKRVEITAELAAVGKTYEDAYAHILASMPKATAILTETNAGKLLDILAQPAFDRIE